MRKLLKVKGSHVPAIAPKNFKGHLESLRWLLSVLITAPDGSLQTNTEYYQEDKVTTELQEKKEGLHPSTEMTREESGRC